MDDITAPRIDSLSQGNDLDKQILKEKLSRKHEKPEKRPPTPSIESDDIVEDAHKIDELA